MLGECSRVHWGNPGLARQPGLLNVVGLHLERPGLVGYCDRMNWRKWSGHGRMWLSVRRIIGLCSKCSWREGWAVLECGRICPKEVRLGFWGKGSVADLGQRSGN
ncbi:hypothetical protein L3X38_032037 [Prunus dulcis]|uniref:Uncharacterized protein n=1 Tax=Prunus dulcis TaxID=3755 RepID=A0AAD4VDB7_PRUDU|nr:hypothetical protein L3X38_032037 [Prunus dulcis]